MILCPPHRSQTIEDDTHACRVTVWNVIIIEAFDKILAKRKGGHVEKVVNTIVSVSEQVIVSVV